MAARSRSPHRCVIPQMTIAVLQETIQLKDQTIEALQQIIQTKDAENAKLKEEIKDLKLEISGCARCGGYASGTYDDHCEECYFTHVFRNEH